MKNFFVTLLFIYLNAVGGMINFVSYLETKKVEYVLVASISLTAIIFLTIGYYYSNKTV